MSSQSCMAFTIIHTAFCLLLFWKYRFWWEVISLSSLICTLVRFMNVENCLIVFFFFSLLKTIWPYVLLLLWHPACWNKIYLYDLTSEKDWDQYFIGTYLGFFYNRNSNDTKEERPRQQSSWGRGLYRCDITLLRFTISIGWAGGSSPRAGARVSIPAVASPSGCRLGTNREVK